MLGTLLAERNNGPVRSLIGLVLVASLSSGCSRGRSQNDEATGIPSDQVDSTPIATDEGDGPAAAALVPLAVGNAWTYRVEGSDDGCVEGLHTMRVLREERVAERPAFALSDYCGRAEEQLVAVQGSQLLEYQNAAWRTWLATPLAEGRNWSETRDDHYTWHKIGWVKVEAGLFADCWQRQPERDNAFSEIFCEGAGVVSVLGPNLRVELVSFQVGQVTPRTVDDVSEAAR